MDSLPEEKTWRNRSGVVEGWSLQKQVESTSDFSSEDEGHRTSASTAVVSAGGEASAGRLEPSVDPAVNSCIARDSFSFKLSTVSLLQQSTIPPITVHFTDEKVRTSKHQP